MNLSVIDTVPVDTGQHSSDAIAASMTLASLADSSGYHRYWFAEHHNTDSVASTSPAILAAAAATRTTRLRVGSGGVMLPNHAPFVVAEQFATLEALAPGRVDLGIGRSTGSDGLVAALLGSDVSIAQHFGDALTSVDQFLDPHGAQIATASQSAVRLRVTPQPTGRPDVWVLGSSARSAEIAGGLGLAYVYAHHFFERGTEAALKAYRSAFRPTAALRHPRVIITVNVAAAPTFEEAIASALPNLLQVARIESGQPLPRFETIEQADAVAGSVAHPDHLQAIADRWFLGTPPDLTARLTTFAQSLEVDEIMLNLASGRHENEPPETVRSRQQTLELLALSPRPLAELRP